MTYVDGYVLAVPKDKKDAYARQAGGFAQMAKREGALQVIEAWQDDVPEGRQTDFFKAVQCKPDEAVVFAWTVWPSKEVRDAAHATFRNDPDMTSQLGDIIFDGKRMIWGGFAPFIEH